MTTRRNQPRPQSTGASRLNLRSCLHGCATTLIVALSLVGCSLDTSPELLGQKSGSGQNEQNSSAPKSGGFQPRSGTASADPDASVPDASDRVGTSQGTPQDADDDAGSTTDRTTDPAPGSPDAGGDTTPADPTTTATMTTTMGAPTTTMPAGNAPECDRERLRAKADEFLQALSTGDPATLNLHPSVRYTENGREEPLGSGIWLRHPKPDFSRHVLDEVRCTTMTEAVLSALTARIVFGVRLLYRDGQLLEAEAQTVPENATLLRDIDGIIPMAGVADPWTVAVPEGMRGSRESLMGLVERYFGSAAGDGTVPASAPDCRRRQNGAFLGDGLCTTTPGTMRFEMVRYPVLDETNGITTAVVRYDGHLGFYMIKVIDGVVQNIEITGGASAASAGW
jgi:hypothetical protein